MQSFTEWFIADGAGVRHRRCDVNCMMRAEQITSHSSTLQHTNRPKLLGIRSCPSVRSLRRTKMLSDSSIRQQVSHTALKRNREREGGRYGGRVLTKSLMYLCKNIYDNFPFCVKFQSIHLLFQSVHSDCPTANYFMTLTTGERNQTST